MDMCPNIGPLAGIQHPLVLQREAYQVWERRRDGLVWTFSTPKYDTGAYDGRCDLPCQIGSGNPM